MIRKNTNSLKLFVMIIFIFFCTSCATPYQKQNWYSHRGGYSEIRLTDNSFRIIFNGNKMTDGDVATDFALLRSAEVTKLNGFNYFVIAINNDSTMYQETYNGIKDILGRPSVINVIYCYKDMPSNHDKKIYEASDIIGKLRDKYKIDKPWYRKL